LFGSGAELHDGSATILTIKFHRVRKMDEDRQTRIFFGRKDSGIVGMPTATFYMFVSQSNTVAAGRFKPKCCWLYMEREAEPARACF